MRFELKKRVVSLEKEIIRLKRNMVGLMTNTQIDWERKQIVLGNKLLIGIIQERDREIRKALRDLEIWDDLVYWDNDWQVINGGEILSLTDIRNKKGND